MKCQILFPGKNKKNILEYHLLKIFNQSAVLTCWVRFSADNILKYFLFYFLFFPPKKQILIVHANHP